MKAAAIFPVGQTAGGCISAIRRILEEDDVNALDVWLIYGQLAPEQKGPDPAECAQQIQNEPYSRSVTWAASEPIEPFDPSKAYPVARGLVRRVEEAGYQRVYAGITGGTNPQVVSVFHSALAYLTAEVVPIYTQAKGPESLGIFVAPDIRLEVLVEEVLRSARSGHLRVAATLAQHLPRIGAWKFVRLAITALAEWDDFNYEAAQSLAQQTRKAEEFAEDERLAALSATVRKLGDLPRTLAGYVKRLRDTGGFGKLALSPTWSQEALRNGVLLVADALANAQRRITEHRFTDAVMRSYRAAECATQIRLLALGLHPSRPDACPAALERFREFITAWEGPRPREISFEAGLQILCGAGEISLDGLNARKDVQQLRNNSYLEHGYVRIQQDDAKRCFCLSMDICGYLLGESVAEQLMKLQMKF